MDSTQQPDDDGIIRIQRMSPDQFDVVLGSPPGKRKPVAPRKRPPYELYAIGLGIVVVSALLVAQLLPRKALAPQPVVQQVLAEPESGALDSVAEQTPVVPEPAAARPIQLEPYTGANVVRHELPVEEQPLDTCLKDGNVIDENVLNCRFGQLPRPAQKVAPQGMVSHTYMADFKAEQTRNKPVRAAPQAEVSQIAIREWDGRNRYEARWSSIDNRIDGSTVCANFPADSVERRECRKAAKVYFKEACSDWGIRFRRDHDDASKRMEQRYCEAMNSFQP